MAERLYSALSRVLLTAGVLLAILPARADGSDVLEFFTDPHSGDGYYDFSYGDFEILSGLKEGDSTRLIDGGGIRLGVSEGAELRYAGPGGGGKQGGAGTLSFKWRNWHESLALNYAVEWRVDDGPWALLSHLTTPGGGSESPPPVRNFSHEINYPGDGVQVRIRNLADSNRVTIGTFSLTGHALPPGDPHVEISPAGGVDFGLLDLFEEGAHTLVISNEGAGEELVVGEETGFSGPGSGSFAIGTPLPLVIPPGGNAPLELALLRA